MTAIIAVLDGQGVHIGTDGREGNNRRKSDNHIKCKILGEKIIYACSGYSSIMDTVERFYSKRSDLSIEDDVLLELREYINIYCDDEYGIIISDGTIIKGLERDLLRYEKKYIWGGSGGLQAISAYNALANTYDYADGVAGMKNQILASIKVAIDMDENCGGEPKYYFLKKQDDQSSMCYKN